MAMSVTSPRASRPVAFSVATSGLATSPSRSSGMASAPSWPPVSRTPSCAVSSASIIATARPGSSLATVSIARMASSSSGSLRSKILPIHRRWSGWVARSSTTSTRSSPARITTCSTTSLMTGSAGIVNGSPLMSRKRCWATPLMSVTPVSISTTAMRPGSMSSPGSGGVSGALVISTTVPRVRPRACTPERRSALRRRVVEPAVALSHCTDREQYVAIGTGPATPPADHVADTEGQLQAGDAQSIVRTVQRWVLALGPRVDEHPRNVKPLAAVEKERPHGVSRVVLADRLAVATVDGQPVEPAVDPFELGEAGDEAGLGGGGTVGVLDRSPPGHPGKTGGAGRHPFDGFGPEGDFFDIDARGEILRHFSVSFNWGVRGLVSSGCRVRGVRGRPRFPGRGADQRNLPVKQGPPPTVREGTGDR